MLVTACETRAGAEPLPIRLRLTLLFAVGIAAAAAIGGVVFVNELSDGLRSSLDRKSVV